MINGNKPEKKGLVRCLVVLLACSMCAVLYGCAPAATSSAQSSAGSDASVSDTSSDTTMDKTTTARTQTHYALYDANKQLKQLSYLDAEYDALNKLYDKAARAWYKGQYYMDLVTCGEITQENEIEEYCSKAIEYFTQATTDANSIYNTLTQ